MDQTGGNGPGDVTRAALEGGWGDVEGIDRWVADARVADAVDQRRRAAWLRRQAAEEATLVGVLADLAEHGRPVVVTVATGGRHRGRLTCVGEDVVGIAASDGELVLVRRDALASVHPEPGSVPVTGDARSSSPTSWHRELSGLHERRCRVSVVVASGDRVVGAIASVGRDLLTLTTDGGGQAHLPLYSVVEVSVPESG